MADVTTDQPPPSPTKSTITDSGHVTPPNCPWCPEYSMNHTPIVRKAQGHSKFSVELPEIQERQRETATETCSHFISGPSATVFLNKHMPWNNATPKDFRKKQPSKAKKDLLASMACVGESAMYEKYIKALANWPLPLKKDKPDYLLTHPKLGNFHDPDTNCGNLAVDIGVYDLDDMPEGHTINHSLMEMQTELKAHTNYDAFVDLEDNQKSPAVEENSEDDEEEEEIEVKEEETEETEDESAEEEEAAQEDSKVDEVVPEDVEVLPDFPFENDSIKGYEDDDAIAWAKFDLFDTDMWHGDAGPKPKRDIKIKDQKLLHINMTLNNETC
ncbi:uncharacterized protein ARMOST_21015 [Armillaria ostoyae]|uniref:Uncharacterized protein n=1 Tax=Armillaria ostoyae TaxID=47428 RepID=A0A284S8Z1_ARMOS|nr:uncharacterized protein ARMOST_21015 [Armillaria ostoyae]